MIIGSKGAALSISSPSPLFYSTSPPQVPPQLAFMSPKYAELRANIKGGGWGTHDLQAEPLGLGALFKELFGG